MSLPESLITTKVSEKKLLIKKKLGRKSDCLCKMNKEISINFFKIEKLNKNYKIVDYTCLSHPSIIKCFSKTNKQKQGLVKDRIPKYNLCNFPSG